MTEQEYRHELKNKLITYRNTLNLPKDVTFGIEIEYENIVLDTFSYILLEEKRYNKNIHGWINKKEFDIIEYNKNSEEMNGEVNSPILKDKLITWKGLSSILELLDNSGAIITNRCGGHVNIGTHLLKNNRKYFMNFILLYLLYEKEIYKFSSGEYIKIRPDYNCLFTKISKDINIEEIIDLYRFEYIKNLPECLYDKLHSIYLNPTSKKIVFDNVIEFRTPNGSLKEEIWQNYINFFAKFVLAAKKDLDVEKTLYKIKNNEHNAVELADYVFDEDIDKENFLIQTLKPNKIYKKQLQKHIIY